MEVRFQIRFSQRRRDTKEYGISLLAREDRGRERRTFGDAVSVRSRRVVHSRDARGVARHARDGAYVSSDPAPLAVLVLGPHVLLEGAVAGWRWERPQWQGLPPTGKLLMLPFSLRGKGVYCFFSPLTAPPRSPPRSPPLSPPFPAFVRCWLGSAFVREKPD
jgi:hypothetical protein